MLRLTLSGTRVTLEKLMCDNKTIEVDFTFHIQAHQVDDVTEMLATAKAFRESRPYIALEGAMYPGGPTVMVEAVIYPSSCELKVYNKFGAVVFTSKNDIEIII